MSQPIRAIRSILTLSIGFGAQSFCHSQDASSTSPNVPVSYTLNSTSPSYSQAGLIRYLQEDAAKGDQLVDTGSIESRDNAQLGLLQSPKGTIELAPLATPNTKIEGIGTGIHPEDVTKDRLPPSQPLPNGETRTGNWGLQAKQWVPGGFCHQPLYFEDPMLERHGHVRYPHLQPAVSGLRFFGTVPMLPYLATQRHPLDDVHTLGAYRPGTAAPVLRYRAHYDPVALRNQFIATAGTAVAIP